MNGQLHQLTARFEGSPSTQPLATRVNINNGQNQSAADRLAALLERVGLDSSDSESGLHSPSPSPARLKKGISKKTSLRDTSNASEFGVVVVEQEEITGSPTKGKHRDIMRPSARLVTKSPTSSPVQTARLFRVLPDTPLMGTSSSDEDVKPSSSSSSLSDSRYALNYLSPRTNRIQDRTDTEPSTSKMAAEIEELKKLLAKQKEENTQLKEKSRAQDEFRESVNTALTCQICWDLLQKPYALNPCGHVCCLVCLQSWFKGDDGSDPSVPPGHHRPNQLRKTCPYCRARIFSRPIPLFIVKSLIESLNMSDTEEEPSDQASVTNDDPWVGIFPDPLDDSTDYSDDSIDSESDEGDRLVCDYCGRVGAVDELGRCVHCGQASFGGGSETDGSDRSDMDEDDRSIDDDSENGSFHSGESHMNSEIGDVDHDDEDTRLSYNSDQDRRYTWVRPRWHPPYIDLERQENLHITNMEFKLCCRGVPFEMIAKFNIQYDPPTGLSAEIEDGLVYLGYNLIDMDIEDVDGSAYMQNILLEMEEKPMRYEVDRVAGSERGYDWVAWRLVAQEMGLGHGSDSDIDR